MKEERRKEEERLAAQQSPANQPFDKVQGKSLLSNPLVSNSRKAQNTKAKDERRRLAQLQELENTIAELEAKLASLSNQLESPLVKPEEVRKIGTEYERVQKEMDVKLGEWEKMQG